jgi:hypothetical protein
VIPRSLGEGILVLVPENSSRKKINPLLQAVSGKKEYLN